MPAGRPPAAPEDRRTHNLQLRLTAEEMATLARLHAAACLDRGRDVPLAEIARELITTHERWARADMVSLRCPSCGETSAAVRRDVDITTSGHTDQRCGCGAGLVVS